MLTGNQIDEESKTIVKNKPKKENAPESSSTNKNKVENKKEQNSVESEGIVYVAEKETKVSSIQNENMEEIKESANYLKIETPEDLDDWIESDLDQGNRLFTPHPTSKYSKQFE